MDSWRSSSDCSAFIAHFGGVLEVAGTGEDAAAASSNFVGFECLRLYLGSGALCKCHNLLWKTFQGLECWDNAKMCKYMASSQSHFVPEVHADSPNHQRPDICGRLTNQGSQSLNRWSLPSCYSDSFYDN